MGIESFQKGKILNLFGIKKFKKDKSLSSLFCSLKKFLSPDLTVIVLEKIYFQIKNYIDRNGKNKSLVLLKTVIRDSNPTKASVLANFFKYFNTIFLSIQIIFHLFDYFNRYLFLIRNFEINTKTKL